MSDIAVYPVIVAERDQTFPLICEMDEAVSVAIDSAIQIINNDTYKGDYVVIPRADEAVVLETKDKTMEDDVTVTAVPYFETHSDTGITVYIASEV